MKIALLFVLAFAGAVSAQASENTIIKSLRCENANLKSFGPTDVFDSIEVYGNQLTILTSEG